MNDDKQVREALVALLELRNRDPAVYDIHHELSKIIALVRGLTSDRPSESAVALANDCANQVKELMLAMLLDLV